MAKLTLLTRDAILAADDIKTEVVDVPEWGGSVMVKALSGAERDRFEKSIVEMRGKKTTVNLDNIRARMVAASLVDEAGKMVFDVSDINALGQKSAAALQRVFVVAQKLSGLTDNDVEELEKN